AVSLQGNLAHVELPLWIPLAWNMLLGSFAPFFFSLLALRYLSATAAGVVATAEIIFAFVFAWLWLGEGLAGVQILGAAVVLIGIVLAQTARKDKVVDADLALSDSETRAIACAAGDGCRWSSIACISHRSGAGRRCNHDRRPGENHARTDHCSRQPAPALQHPSLGDRGDSRRRLGRPN